MNQGGTFCPVVVPLMLSGPLLMVLGCRWQFCCYWQLSSLKLKPASNPISYTLGILDGYGFFFYFYKNKPIYLSIIHAHASTHLNILSKIEGWKEVLVAFSWRLLLKTSFFFLLFCFLNRGPQDPGRGIGTLFISYPIIVSSINRMLGLCALLSTLLFLNLTIVFLKHQII